MTVADLLKSWISSLEFDRNNRKTLFSDAKIWANICRIEMTSGWSERWNSPDFDSWQWLIYDVRGIWKVDGKGFIESMDLNRGNIP